MIKIFYIIINKDNKTVLHYYWDFKKAYSKLIEYNNNKQFQNVCLYPYKANIRQIRDSRLQFEDEN